MRRCSPQANRPIENDSIFVKLMLAVTAHGMRNVVWDLHDRDFEFLVDGTSYRVNSVLAEFLSPKVCKMRRSDATVSSYELHIRDEHHVFEQIIRIGMGESFALPSDNLECLMNIARNLENTELTNLLVSLVEQRELTVDSVVDVFLQKQVLGLDTEKESQFIANNFYQFTASGLLKLDLDTVSHILSLDSLQLSSEDTLYHVITNLMSAWGNRAVCLFEFVRFEYLSESCIVEFVELSQKFGVEMMNANIWTQICRRLLVSTQSARRSGGKRFVDYRDRHFEYDGANLFNGIVAHLTKHCGENIVDANVVKIMSSHEFAATWHPKHLFDFSSPEVFKSADAENVWLSFDFGEIRIRPNGYSLKTDLTDGGRGMSPRSWVIEGSEDGISWVELDCREDNDSLNGMESQAMFSITNVPSRGVRFLRFRQTGLNHWGSYAITLSAFEIFGEISYT